jgi:7-cyano-7-deazaguanine synthase
MHSAVLSFSGGLDSTTVLAWLLRKEFGKIHCVNFQYGSKHNEHERKAAEAVLAHYTSAAATCEITYEVVDLSSAFAGMQSNLLLSGADIPEGHYEAENMKQTVVPARNLIFLSILSGMAWSRKSRYVAIGVHHGDHAIYPDCRPEFCKIMDTAIFLGTDKNVQVLAPFINMTKGQIVKYGTRIHVPYHLTRTCYKNQVTACGKCGSCVERQEAFTYNKMHDPIPYDTEESTNGKKRRRKPS